MHRIIRKLSTELGRKKDEQVKRDETLREIISE